MANKKITVLGDAGDTSLTPEETHKIEVKIDKMMAVNGSDADGNEAADQDTTPAAPPVIKHEAKVIEPPRDDPEDDFQPTAPAPAKPAPKPATKIAITIADDETPPAPETEQEPESSIESVPSAPPLQKPGKKSKKPVDTEPLTASEVPDTPLNIPLGAPELEAEPEAAPEGEPEEPETPAKPAPLTPAPETKKYQPPQGPMPFKRAEESPTTTPALTDQQAEDAAIAMAFEAEESIHHKKGTTKPKATSSKKKVVALLVLLVLLGGAGVAAFTVPAIKDRITGKTNPSPQATTTRPQAPATTATTTTQPAGYDVYMARKDGIYNVYKAPLTGKDSQLLLAGTGNEDADSALVPNGQNTLAALVSIRDKQKDTAGYSLQRLTLIDMVSGSSATITQAQRVYVMGWFGKYLVYVTAKTGASTTDTAAYQLLSYDTTTKQAKVLDQANHFNSVLSARGALYYATSTPGGANNLVKILPDGSKKQVILDKPVFSIYRTGYDDVALATAGSWYNLKLSTGTAVQTANAYTGKGLLYVDAPDGKHSVRIASDGSLLLYDVKTGLETTLTKQAGASYPVNWAGNSTLIYRIDTANETADYTVNLTNPQPAKVADVSSVAGLELW